MTSSPSTTNLLRHLSNGTACGVSDGSYYPDKKVGSCAWILSTPASQEWIQGGGIIPGDASDQDPYRSELGGQLGLAAIAAGIQLPNGVTPNLEVACDGKYALSKVHIGREFLKCNQ